MSWELLSYRGNNVLRGTNGLGNQCPRTVSIYNFLEIKVYIFPYTLFSKGRSIYSHIQFSQKEGPYSHLHFSRTEGPDTPIYLFLERKVHIPPYTLLLKGGSIYSHTPFSRKEDPYTPIPFTRKEGPFIHSKGRDTVHPVCSGLHTRQQMIKGTHA